MIAVPYIISLCEMPNEVIPYVITWMYDLFLILTPQRMPFIIMKELFWKYVSSSHGNSSGSGKIIFLFLFYPFVKSMFDDKSAFMKYDERAASNFHDDKMKKWLLPWKSCFIAGWREICKCEKELATNFSFIMAHHHVDRQ